MSNNQNDVLDLFDSAVNDDGLDAGVSMILVDNLDAVALAGCVGTELDQLSSDDITLVAVVLDESPSMTGVQRDVITGYNAMLAALADSNQAHSILLSAWAFSSNTRLLFSYTPVPQVSQLTTADYDPNNGDGTALYDAVLDVMVGLVAYGQHLRNNGVRTRCVVVVFSDGEDNSSHKTSQQVRTVSEGLLAQEIYSLAYAGFGSQDLRRVADSIGFPSVITTASSASEIRRIFHQVSRSVIRASQTTVGAGNNFFI